MLRWCAVPALLVLSVEASLFCPHTLYPSGDNDMVIVTVQAKQQADNGPYYRISDDEADPAFKRLSPHFKMLTARDNNECPFRGCMVELSPAEPKNHNTRLYQTSVIGKMIPPGFFPLEISQRLYCVLTEGDCGADVPLYRHYRVTAGGIYHAYTVDSAEIIENYIKESTPLCYVWSRQRPNVAQQDSPPVLFPALTLDKILPKPARIVSHERELDPNSAEDNTVLDLDELCSHDNNKAVDSAMQPLNELFNHKEGLDKDHIYTVKKTVDGYSKQGVLGKVVTDLRDSNCKCLVQLVQMKFQGENGLPGLDHKLVREQLEPASLNRYFLTGEQIYCAPEEGACGATVPLRKFYNFGDADSMMTAGSETAPPMSGPLPVDVLCWIWPTDYHMDSTEAEVEEEQLSPVDPVHQVKQQVTDATADLEGSGSGDEGEQVSSAEKSESAEKKAEPATLRFKESN